MMTKRPTRGTAALAHLIGSVLIVGSVAAVVFGLWYPGPFRQLSGGATLFLILACVDVTLGPLLTAVVFNPNKKRHLIALDLGVILVVQVAALAYGVWTMAAARPVFVAFEIDLFRVVSAADVVEDQLTEAPAGLRALPWSGPVPIATTRPSADRSVEATMLGLSGVHLAMQPRYWQAYEAQRAAVLERSRPVSDLPPQLRQRLPAELLPWPHNALPPIEHMRWLPVMGRQANWTLFVDRTGALVAFAPFDVP